MPHRQTKATGLTLTLALICAAESRRRETILTAVLAVGIDDHVLLQWNLPICSRCQVLYEYHSRVSPFVADARYCTNTTHVFHAEN